MTVPIPEANGFIPGSLMTPGVSVQAPSVAGLLASAKAPVGNVDLSKIGSHSPSPGAENPFWSAAKNVLDFIETPFYMATNTADLNFEKMDKGEDANSLGSFLDDIRQGAARGWEAGINHNPQFTKDWVDVIEHAQKGTPDEGNTTLANAVGIPLDLLIDPINAIPSAGIVGGALKGTGKAIGAAREAMVGGKELAEGGAAAAKVPEAIAQEAGKGAQTAEKAPFVVDSGGQVEAPKPAPEPPAMPTSEQAQQSFYNAPPIKDLAANVQKGPLTAAGSAFLSTFKNSVADSQMAKIGNSFLEGLGKKDLAKPIPATPENIVQAHLQGAVDKDALEKQPIPTMAQPEPEEIKLPKEEPEAPTGKDALKQEELTNSAAHNTLAHAAWANMDRTAQFKARNAEALSRNVDIGLGHTVKTEVDRKAAGPVELPGYRLQKEANDTVKAVQDYQLKSGPDISKTGYRGPKERTEGAGPEAGGITHPFLYNTAAAQLPFQRALDFIRRLDWNAKTKTGELGEGVKVDRYSKAPLVTKMLKAEESTLFARGMAPVANLSKYTTKGTIGPHISLGDVLEAGMAKSIPGGKYQFTSQQVRDHLIGSSAARAVNPMAMTTAIETLHYGRRNIFSAIKRAGGKIPADKLEALLGDSEKGTGLEGEVYRTLMGEPSAYNDAGKTLLPRIQRTISDAKDAIESRGYSTSYEKDMQSLAKKIVRDPHLGEMLEQRHLYHQALHASDIKSFVEKNWGMLKQNLQRFAEMDMNASQAIQWMEKAKKDAKNLLPEMDRSLYDDWIGKLESQTIKPSEKTAALANKATAKTARDAEKDATPVVAKSFEPGADFPATLSDIKVGAIVTDTMRRVHPVKSFFNAKFPFFSSDFYDTMMSGLHSRSRGMNMVNQLLKEHIMKYPKNNQLFEDFSKIQAGAVDKEGLSGTAQELHKIIGAFVGSDVPFVNSLKTRQLSADYFRQMVEKYLPEHVNLQWLEKAKYGELPDFWKHTTFKDSLATADFLSKMSAMALHIYNDQSIAASFMKHFASPVAKEGYQQITWNNRGYSTGIIRRKGYTESRRIAEKNPGFYDALDRNLYYEHNAALEIPLIHRLMNESRAISNDTILGQFVNNVFDPVTQIMKLFQTTLRPGHWGSNLMGDHVRMYMAGVKPDALAPAYRVMYALGRDKGMYKTIPQKLDRLTKVANKDYKVDLKNEEDSIVLGGGRFRMSLTEIGRRLEDNGSIVSPHLMGQHEDFVNSLDTANGTVIKAVNGVMDKVLSAKLGGTSINELAALRDNTTRVPIAMDELLHNNTAKDVDELFDKAFARVRKWAPTSQDFTREESMYARRMIFYYTWLRGMLPNIVETLTTKPGVYMMPNKALYAIAKAQGVDPMSIGNPFPVNQMFPSYYYENVIGPQIKKDGGQLWGFSPMAPTIDVLDTVLHGVNSQNAAKGNILPAVGENLLGMANPFIQIPAQALTGQSNGVPIKDTAQYLQDQILPPQLDLLSKMSGKELYNWNQNRTDKGNSDPNVELANFLTGLHITDYNSPAAERAVMGENKDAKSTLRADAKRNAR